MGNRKLTKATLNRQVARVRERAEAYGRTGEFEAFERITNAFLRAPASRNRRGVSAGAIADAHMGYERLGETLLVVEKHEDHALRHQAEKALRAIGRGHVDFERASERLRAIRGANRQSGKRSQERRRIKEETEERLNGRFSVKRICSVQTLQAVGRVLQNCCGESSTARDYLRDSEMWVLLDRGKPFWLLDVDADRNLQDCRGHGNGDAEPGALGRQTMRRLLKVLDVSADEFPAFVIAGYHSALLGPDVEDVDPIKIERREFVVRRCKDWVLLGRRKNSGQPWKWSPFRWKSGGSLEATLAWDQPVSDSKLLGLIVRCPELAARIRN